jgi:4a-hydroxytetrahydrobiopterin dehydratase
MCWSLKGRWAAGKSRPVFAGGLLAGSPPFDLLLAYGNNSRRRVLRIPTVRRITMQTQSTDQLVAKKCVSCEGGVAKYTLPEAQAQLKTLSGWRLTYDGQRIRKDWVVKNFMAGIKFFNRVAETAEAEGHHPDLHLEGYRNVWIELWTHAIGGLSENDFILAAKIDQLPIELKKSSS